MPNPTHELSPEEFGVFQDRQFMPLKQRAWEKLEGILWEWAEKQQQLLKELRHDLPLDLMQVAPKISRGENYNSYSYRVLDYPRLTEKADIFLFRSMLLWGHPIGFHLILSGKYQEEYAAKLVEELGKSEMPILYAAQDTPWIWEADAEGWVDLKKLMKTSLGERKFCKISTFLPIETYQKISERGEEFMRLWLEGMKGK